MICFGTRRRRRIGKHAFTAIGRAIAYGPRTFKVKVCFYCDRATVTG